jgi:hypothetical protein
LPLSTFGNGLFIQWKHGGLNVRVTVTLCLDLWKLARKTYYEARKAGVRSGRAWARCSVRARMAGKDDGVVKYVWCSIACPANRSNLRL